MAERITLRSYRTVFAFERRLHRFDQWRIPLRGGLPLRALLYAPVAWGLVLLLAQVPGLGMIIAALPAPVVYALVPGVATAALLRLQPDGRPAARALWSLVRWRLEPRWLAALRGCPAPGVGPVAFGQLHVCPDWRAERYRAGRIVGPARLLLRAPATLFAVSDKRVVLTAGPGRCVRAGRVVHLPAGALLELRCERR